jgi:signal transduction histidine kinase
MTGQPAGRPTIKAAILVGFGLTLGLWLWAGYDFIQRMSRVQREAEAIDVRYMRAQELLANVRPQVLIVSVTVRTALLDPDLGNRHGYRRRITDTLRSVDETLERYVPVLDSQIERERVERLQQEIGNFGHAVLQVLEHDRSTTAYEARDVLARIVPRRELVIGVTDEVQALNRAAFVQQQKAIAASYRDTQARVWERLGLSLLASLGIAVFATFYAGRLESRLQRQRLREVQHTRDLQQLSARLVGAQERERRVIARELHDELGQVLMAIQVELGLARKALDASGAGELLNDAQAITKGAVNTVRDLSHLLHPAVLDDLGLVAAVDCYLESLRSRHALRTRFEHESAVGRLAPETEIAAYRIVQEAVTNAVKHAHATSCTVTVRHLPDTLSISIEDDGCGFDPVTTDMAGAAAGLGLIGIRERVAQLQGVLRVESAPGQGTTVTLELPISSPTPATSSAVSESEGFAARLKTEAISG